MSEVREGYWMFEIGKTEDNAGTKGLAFLVHPKIKMLLLILRRSNRSINMELNLQEKDSVTVMNAYAPASSTEDEKVE